MEDPYEKIQRMANLRFRILVAVCLVAAGVAFYVKVRPFPFRFLKLASGVEAFELEVATPLSALLESRGIDPQSVSEVWICDTRNESSLNYDTFPPPLAGGQEVYPTYDFKENARSIKWDRASARWASQQEIGHGFAAVWRHDSTARKVPPSVEAEERIQWRQGTLKDVYEALWINPATYPPIEAVLELRSMQNNDSTGSRTIRFRVADGAAWLTTVTGQSPSEKGFWYPESSSDNWMIRAGTESSNTIIRVHGWSPD